MHTTTVRVRYGETDQGGVAYHANYLHWFEVGRTEMLRELGLPYGRFEAERKLYLTVVEADLRYLSPARYDEVLIVKSWTSDLRRVRMRIDTEIWSEARAELLCRGGLWLACINLEGRPVPFPEDFEVAVRRTVKSSSGKTGAAGVVRGSHT